MTMHEKFGRRDPEKRPYVQAGEGEEGKSMTHSVSV
jgi:hypothetical protein